MARTDRCPQDCRRIMVDISHIVFPSCYYDILCNYRACPDQHNRYGRCIDIGWSNSNRHNQSHNGIGRASHMCLSRNPVYTWARKFSYQNRSPRWFRSYIHPRICTRSPPPSQNTSRSSVNTCDARSRTRSPEDSGRNATRNLVLIP